MPNFFPMKSVQTCHNSSIIRIEKIPKSILLKVRKSLEIPMANRIYSNRIFVWQTSNLIIIDGPILNDIHYLKIYYWGIIPKLSWCCKNLPKTVDVESTSHNKFELNWYKNKNHVLYGEWEYVLCRYVICTPPQQIPLT